MDGDLEAADAISVNGHPSILRRPAGRRPHPKWLARLLVPFGLFAHYFDLRVLNPLNAARMMTSIDWTTYIVSPNYLRTGPLLSLPIGQIPRYTAPVGTALARTDTMPILTPVYRLLLWIFPHRPIQILGVVLLVGFVGTFVCITWFLDKVRTVGHPIVREATILCFATIGTLAPFWTVQFAHPTLMQGWIIVLAIAGALRRCPTAFGGAIEQTSRRWTGLGPIIAAAIIQPYFLPMVFLVAIAPDLARVRTEGVWVLRKASTAIVSTVVLDWVLGYIGGGDLGSKGFGVYPTDLIALVDPNGKSRYVRDLPSLSTSYEGYGWAGLGGLVLLVVAAVALHRRRLRGLRSPVDPVPDRHAALPFRLLCGAVGLTTLYALLPRIRFARHVLIDLKGLTDNIRTVTALFRVNGRFIMVLVWLLLIGAMATIVLLKRPAVALTIAALAMVVQVFDVLPWTGFIRPEGSVHYTQAVTELLTELASGRNTIEVQPPVLAPFCYQPKVLTFDQLGDVLLAASVLGIPSSAGYLSREDPTATAKICTDQRNAFKAGTYSPHTIYVMADSVTPPSALECRPLTPGLIVCDYTPA